MNIPVEIVATILGVVGTAIFAGIGFCYGAILKINVRLARIEEHFGIKTQTENPKEKTV